MRIYVDTSVIGGCFDKEFAADSKKFLELVKNGQIRMLISEIVVDELAKAPNKVRLALENLPPESLEIVDLTQEVKDLRDAYLTAGILTTDSKNDATHVAAATIHDADAIVSWNFKHIVQLGKMRMYNRVNQTKGYGYLNIVSPKEVSSEPE